MVDFHKELLLDRMARDFVSQQTERTPRPDEGMARKWALRAACRRLLEMKDVLRRAEACGVAEYDQGRGAGWWIPNDVMEEIVECAREVDSMGGTS